MRWAYTFGNQNTTPGPGEMYQRTSNRRVRFNKTDFDGQDATELLASLFDYDRVGYDAEELWEIKKNGINDNGDYVEFEMNDLMSDTEDSFLPAEVYEFEFFPMGDRDTGEKKRSKLGKNKPPKKEWDAQKTKLNGRQGMPPGWVDTVLDDRERSRDEQAHRMSIALATQQTPGPSVIQLVKYLMDEGWAASGELTPVIVDNGVTYEILQEWLEACDFSEVDNPPLAKDLRDGMQDQGFCTGGCK